MIRHHLVAMIVVVLAPTAYAQARTPSPSQSPAGHPDLSGAWTSTFITPLERIPGAASLTVGESEAAALGERLFQQSLARENGLDPDVLAGDVRNLLRVGDSYRTSVVVDPADGKLPYRPEARERIDAFRNTIPRPPSDPELRNNQERCIAGHGQTPFTLTPTINPRQIVQTADDLVIYTEDGPDTRIISFTHDAADSSISRWGGRSLGHWDNADLVIETSNIRGGVRGGVQGSFLLSDEASIVERLSFVATDTLLYRYTVTDPANYLAPWSGEFVLTRSATAAREYACHEGNLSMYHMLLAARAAEAHDDGALKPR